MSYELAGALQGALYARLTGDVDLGSLVGGAVFDAAPAGALPETYVTLGPEDVRDRSDADGPGALHEVVISIVSTANGFLAAKEVARAVGAAMESTPPAMSIGRIVWLKFYKARAQRTAKSRRIDLRYRARVTVD